VSRDTGDHRVTLMDASGDGTVSGSDTSASKDGPLAQPDQKAADLEPVADVKPWPQPDTTGSHDIGKICQVNSDCMFNLCATNTHTGTKFCTKTCNPCTASPCPTGSGCQNAGIAYICAPGYPDAPCPP